MNNLLSLTRPLKNAGFIVIILALLMASCASPEKSRYFDQSIPATYPAMDAKLEPVIQNADILNITVTSLNPEASAMYNAPNTVTNGVNGMGAMVPNGYLVDNEGAVTFPVLGKIQATGFTKKQLSDSIKTQLAGRQLLVDPIVSIRILNFRVTVLGEVQKPMVVSVVNEKISLLEAIGMAGDLTLSAKRDNILLIREENGKKITRRINLNNEEIFRSPYYYLKNNDIVYVESNNAKVQSTSRLNALLPSILSGLAVVAIVLDRIKF
jgi:polysaccharide biosynthesis/export protein